MKIYLAHPFADRFWLRMWEIGMESCLTCNLHEPLEIVNPFYDLNRSDVQAIDENKMDRYACNPAEVVERDLLAMAECDRVVAFVTGSRSYGTIQEIVYADLFGIPADLIVLNGEQKHYWLQYHAKNVFTQMLEYEDFLESLLSKDAQNDSNRQEQNVFSERTIGDIRIFRILLEKAAQDAKRSSLSPVGEDDQVQGC